MRLALLACLLWAPAAGADLYRWVDPESGSVKFSSYPPPWHGDPAKERRAPKVQVIPSARGASAAPVPAAAGAGPAAEPPDAGQFNVLELQRKSLLQQIPALAAQARSGAGAPALTAHLEAYRLLSDEIDRLDPRGAAARRLELQALMQQAAPRSAR